MESGQTPEAVSETAGVCRDSSVNGAERYRGEGSPPMRMTASWSGRYGPTEYKVVAR